MRILSSELESAQQSNNRKPFVRATVYDTLLRFSKVSDSTVSNMPSLSDAGGIPYATLDGCVMQDGNLVYAWVDSDGNVMRMVYDLSTFTPTVTQVTTGSIPNQKPGVDDAGNIYHFVRYNSLSAHLYKNDAQASTQPWVVYDAVATSMHNRASSSDVTFYNLMLQETVNGLNEDRHTLYIDYFSNFTSTDGKYITFVPDEYSSASLTWFAAVSLGTLDIIIFNYDVTGRPMIVRRRRGSSTTDDNGKFGNPYPMIPVDIVDNFSYLRIGWAHVYNGVIYATGELGRKGSTGRHPQSMGVILRSKDGISWTMDRYRYFGETPMRSPILFSNGFAYKLGTDGKLYRAPLTPLFGLDDGDVTSEHVKIDIKEDILGGSVTHGGTNTVPQLNIELSNLENKYSIGSNRIKPGYMLRLYGGYEDTGGEHEVLIGTYSIDSVPMSSGSPGNTLVLRCSDMAMKMLRTNYFDQDWQWLSQTRHHDTCVDISKMYSLGSYTLDVDNDTNLLKYNHYNEPLVSIFTQRPKTEDYCFSAIFSFGDDAPSGQAYNALLGTRTSGSLESGYTVPDGYSCWSSHSEVMSEINNYQYPNNYLGSGFGLVFEAVDDKNFNAAFVDIVNNKLYILEFNESRYGDDEFSVLHAASISGGFSKDTRYRISIDKIGYSVYVRLEKYSSSDSSVTGVYSAKISSTSSASHMLNNEAGSLLGIITNIRVPEAMVGNTVADSPYLPFDWSYFLKDECYTLDGTHTPCQCDGMRFFDFREGSPIYIGSDENQYHIYRLTPSRWSSAYTRTWALMFGPTDWVWYASGGDSSTGPFSFGQWWLGTNYATIDSNKVCTRIRNYYNSSWAKTTGVYDTSSRPYFGWLYHAIYGPGAGLTTLVLRRADGTRDLGDGKGAHYAEIMDLPPEDTMSSSKTDLTSSWVDLGPLKIAADRTWANSIVGGQSYAAPTHYALVPGIVISQDGGDSPGRTGGAIPARTVVKSHYNNYIAVHDILMCDVAEDMTIDRALKDIAAKAGILSFAGSVASASDDTNKDVFSIYPSAHTTSLQRDNISIEFTGSGTPQYLYVRFSPNGLDAGDTLGASDVAVDLEITVETDGSVSVAIKQKNSEIASATTVLDRTYSFNNFRNFSDVRVSKSGSVISLWICGRLITSYAVVPIYGLDSDGYNSFITGPCYISAIANDSCSMVVRELAAIADGLIGDQGMSASQMLDRAIRDARIKFFPTPSGGLKISSFVERDNLGYLSDVIYSINRSENDGIPTHVRVIGAEISEYFDHDAASEYGVIFTPIRAESLDEDEAYEEAVRIVDDAESYSLGGVIESAAQLDFEPEDMCSINLTTVNGEHITGTYIVDSVTFSFGVAKLEISARLRGGN